MTTGNFSAFRLTPQQTKERQRIINDCCALFYPVMCSIYNAASAAMTDCMPMLKSSPLFRHEAKWHAKAAMKAYEKIESKIRIALEDRYQLWLDVSDEVYEELRPIIKEMRTTCSKYLHYKRVAGHDFKAMLQVSVTINDIAVCTFDKLMKTFQDKVGADISYRFQEGSFKDVARHWELATEPFLKSGGDDVNLNRAVSFSNAVHRFMETIGDYEMYNRTAEKAIRLNPDSWRYLSEHDRKLLQDGEPLHWETHDHQQPYNSMTKTTSDASA